MKIFNVLNSDTQHCMHEKMYKEDDDDCVCGE